MFFFPALVVLKIMLNSILVRAWTIRILLDMVVSAMEGSAEIDTVEQDSLQVPTLLPSFIELTVLGEALDFKLKSPV